MNPLCDISIVIPSFNVEGYIEDAIRSVGHACSLTHEIIVVDNGSTDGTMQKLKSLQAEFSTLIVAEEYQRGASHARNKGLTMARGEYIQFLDADDLLEPGKLDHQWQVAHQFRATIVAASYTRLTTAQRRVSVPVASSAWLGLFTTRLGITSSCLFQTKAVRQVHGWNTELKSSQEYDLMFRLMRGGAHVALDTTSLTTVRDREEGQISTSDPRPRWKHYIELRAEVLDTMRDLKVDEFLADEPVFLQAFYDQLHIAFHYQPALCAALYKKYLKGSFTPAASAAVTPAFVRLHKTVGFVWAERIKGLVKRA